MTAPSEAQSLRDAVARAVSGDVSDLRAAIRDCIGETIPLRRRWVAATQTGDLAFIVSEHGRAFTKESFGNWFRKVCREAGVPGSAHGLRKAGARRAAEAGATEAQLNALYGWTPGSQESAVYTSTVNNAHLARNAPIYPAPTTKVRDKLKKLNYIR